MEEMENDNLGNFRLKIQTLIKRPLFLFLTIGLVGRFACAALLTYDYDVYHWAVIMQNINSGNGLYELTGYFYTPVWGYYMGLIDLVWNVFFSIDTYGETVTGFAGIEDLVHIFHISTITTPVFNFAIKVPLIICDVIVGYLIHGHVKQRTKDVLKADYAFGLWFLCPIVFYMSGIQGMFDTISALLTLSCVIFILRDHFFTAGIFLSLATLLKVFPGACALVFVIYAVKKYGNSKECCTRLLLAVLGGLVGIVVIMLPNILAGNVSTTLTFMTDRGIRTGYASLFQVLLGAFLFLFIAYRFFREKNQNVDDRLTIHVMCTLACTFVLANAPQYMIVMIPFLIISAICTEKMYVVCYWVIGTGAAASAFIQNNFSLLASSSVYFDVVSPEWILSGMRAIELNVLGITLMNWLNSLFILIETLGILLVVLIYLEDDVRRKFPRSGRYYDKLRGKRGCNQ